MRIYKAFSRERENVAICFYVSVFSHYFNRVLFNAGRLVNVIYGTSKRGGNSFNIQVKKCNCIMGRLLMKA